jgi:uncharacterized membrane protein
MKKYTGYAYVKKLERCLRKMPYEERLDAVNYYSEYLAEAGSGREREVIERLGPPQRVAAELRADAALRELNAKTKLSEKVKTERITKNESRRNAGRARYKTPQEPSPDNASADVVQRPGMSESFSAAGLGALGMLSMPVARPLAVLACVLGIFGLVLGVIVVAVIFAAAGAVAVGGAFCFATSFMLIPQYVSSAVFLAGAGLACLGVGLVIGTLNYMLGRAIFKGIAILSGRVRHKKIKINKEKFNYSYMNEMSGASERDDASGAIDSAADAEKGAGKDTEDEQQA